MNSQLPLFNNEIIEAMQSVQAQEEFLSSKYGLNPLTYLNSDEYKELQRLIGVAVDACSKHGVNYFAMYEVAKGV